MENILVESLKNKLRKTVTASDASQTLKDESRQVAVELVVELKTLGINLEPYSNLTDIGRVLPNFIIKADGVNVYDQPEVMAIFGGQVYKEPYKIICGQKRTCNEEMTINEYEQLYKNTMQELIKNGLVIMDMIEEAKGMSDTYSGRKHR